MSEAALSSWRTDFPEGPPVGYLLREAAPTRWLRIHSLPASKRYPDTEAEMQEVLRRHAVVASDVLGTGPCLLVSTTFDDPPDGDLSIPNPDDPPDGRLNLSVQPVQWSPRLFEDHLRAVANDASGPTLFYAVGQGRAFAPYDGGADLFWESKAVRDARRERYADWLSSHPLGL